MFFHGKKEIGIIEYTCSSARTPYASLVVNRASTVSRSMEFSSIKLSIAMARTILSYDPTNLDLVLQSMSSFFNYQSIINTGGRNLSIVDNIRERFRDFSLTGRVGELAQALNYIFIQEVLRKPLVVDFEGFLLRRGYLGRYPFNGKAPDFIAGRASSNIISLIESKGACPNEEGIKLKTTLRKGLEQCENGRNYFATNHLPFVVQNTYTSGVWFSTPLNTWNTAIHFADPEYISDEKQISDPIMLAKYHYASWFTLTGYYRQALELVSNDNITLEDPQETRIINNEKFYVLNLDNYFMDYFYGSYDYASFYRRFYYKSVRFGISQRVWRILKGDNSQDIENKEFYFEPISNDDMELFADGTIIFFY